MSDRSNAWSSHFFVATGIVVDGVTYQHRSCIVCHRDFAKLVDEETWQAANVSARGIQFLDDNVSLRWRTQPCSKTVLVADVRDRRRLKK
jgi:hypothetical protein